jgi:hypothetical protein
MPFAAPNAHASGAKFEPLSIDWQDKHGRRNDNGKSKGAHT